ncbi:hypothetical protein V4B17_01705 [Bartonella sp. B23]
MKPASAWIRRLKVVALSLSKNWAYSEYAVIGKMENKLLEEEKLQGDRKIYSGE